MVRDNLKRIPAAAMFVCSVIMTVILYTEFSGDLPQLKRTGALYAPVLVILLAVFLFLRELKTGRKLLFRLFCLAMLFVCNVFSFGGVKAQIVMVFAFILDVAVDNIRLSQPANLAVVVVCLLLCGVWAAMVTPLVEKIHLPQVVTDLQSKWFSIFDGPENPAAAQEQQSAPNSQSEVSAGRLAGNVITNDLFDPADQTPCMTVTSNYSLDKMMIFACYDYDPELTRFELADPSDPEDARADHYFDKAFSAGKSGAQMYYWADIQDSSIYMPLRLVPFSDFTANYGADLHRDSYISTEISDVPQFYKYYIDPEVYYQTASSDYGSFVTEKYLSVPGEFRDKLTAFLAEKGISADSGSKNDIAKQLLELFQKEYTYSNEPPVLPEGEDPVMWFIFESKTGYSKHFAAAEVLLLRAAGIPARYAYGYNINMRSGGSTVKDENDISTSTANVVMDEIRTASVNEGDAYAFCQVFTDGSWQIISELRSPASSDVPKEVDPQKIPVVIPDEESDEEPDAPDIEAGFNWKAVAVPATVIAAIAAVVFLCRWLRKKFAPTVLQRINLSYKALKKYYFVRDDILSRMLKVRYSKAGPEEEDALMLERELSVAVTHFRRIKKFFTLARLKLFVRMQKTMAVISNIFKKH